MSTRTNILIKSGDTKVWLYRHHDGYLSETGYNLASVLANCKGFDSFLNGLLEQKHDASIYRKSEHVYEFTTEQHGDIEYLYTIEFERHVYKSVKFKAEHVASWEKQKTLIDTEYFEISRNEVSEQLKLIIKEKDDAFKRFYKSA